jgi:hypothetical protein
MRSSREGLVRTYAFPLVITIEAESMEEAKEVAERIEATAETLDASITEVWFEPSELVDVSETYGDE